MLFAESEFELGEAQDDGGTLRDHLLSVQRQTGFRPEQLNQPDFPETLRLPWRYFRYELIGARSSGMGITPISYTEIEAWNRLTGAEITPVEVRIVKALDNKYLAYHNKKAAK